jgi:hypothetical protein
MVSSSRCPGAGQLARRAARDRVRDGVGVVAPLAWITVGAWPDLDSLSLRRVIGTAILFAFTAALGVALRGS